MADLKIMLTADLDINKSVADLNKAIEKIQDKIVKLKLNIDTKALTDAGVILRNLSDKADQAGRKAQDATSNILKANKRNIEQSNKDLASVEASIRRINNEIGKSTPKQYTVNKSLDANGKMQIDNATISYTNEMGKTISKNLEWVVRQVDGVQQMVFAETSQKFKQNISTYEREVNRLKSQIDAYRHNLSTGRSGVTEQAEVDKLTESYNALENKIISKQGSGQQLQAKSVQGIKDEILALQRETEELSKQQKIRDEINKKAQEFGNKVYNQAEAGKQVVVSNNYKNTNTPFLPDNQAADLAKKYQGIMNIVDRARAQGREVNEKEITEINLKMSYIDKLTAKYTNMQKEVMRVGNLGTKLGNISSSGIDLKNASANQDLYRQQIASYMSAQSGANVTEKDVRITSQKAFDPTTGQRLDNVVVKIRDAAGAYKEMKLSIDQASDSVRSNGLGNEVAAMRQLGVLDKLRQAMAQIPVWMVGMTAFYGTLHFFRDGANYVNEMNKSLTQLSIVFNQSQSQIAHYGQDFHDMGMKMGMTAQEISKGAVEYARQGMNPKDMITNMTEAAKYAKISNIDANEAAKILTATVNSMGVSSQHAADIFSYMGDKTATGADEIGRALQRVGGTAKTANIPFEQLSSWIAVVSAKTREGSETIGNAFKSIVARYQSIKETGFNAEDATNINQVTKALSEVGIKATDNQGQLRNFGDVMNEVAKIFPTLNTKQKDYIATTMAGTYQQSRFLNLMNGYPESIKLYQDSLSQGGIANQKFDLYLQGTEAHLTTMKESWNGLFQASFNSSALKQGADALAGLGVAASKLIDVFGLLPTAMVGLAGFMALIKPDIFKKFAESVNSFNFLKSFEGIDNATAKVGGFRTKILDAVTSMETLKIAGKATAIGLMDAFAPFIVMFAIGFAIEKVTSAIVKHNEEVAKQAAYTDKIVASYTQQNDVIMKLKAQYLELDKATNSGKSTDDNANKEYFDTAKKLSDLMPNLIDKVDTEGKVRLKNASAMEKELQYAQKLTEAKAKETLTASANELKLQQKDTKNIEDQIKQKQQELNNYKNNPLADWWQFGGNEYRQSQIAIVERQLIELEQNLSQNADKIKDHFGKIADAEITYSKVQFAEPVKKQISDITSSLDGSFSKDPTQTDALVKNMVDRMAEVQKVMKDPNISMQQAQITIQKLKDALSALGKTPYEIDKIVNQFLGVKSAAEGADQAVINYKASFDALDAQYTKSAGVLSTLNKMMEESSQGKQLNAKDVMDLVNKDATLVDMFKVEHGQIVLNTQAVNDRRKAEHDAYNDIAQKEKEKLDAQGQSLIATLQNYGIEIQAIGELKKKKDELDGKVQMEDALGHGIMAGKMRKDSASVDEFTKKMDEYTKKVQLGNAALNQVGESSSGVTQTTESVSKLQKAIDDVNNAIEKTQNAQQKYAKSSQEYRNAVNDEITLLKQKRDLLLQGVNNPSGLMPIKDTVRTTGGGTARVTGAGSNVAGQYSDYINKYASQYGVDPSLIQAVAQQESSMGANGVVNVMQVNGMDNSTPEQSIQAGTKMLAELLTKTDGDVTKALSAYNMGAGVLGYFNANGGYSYSNMQGFSEYQKRQNGYSSYGDPDYIAHVMRYYHGSAITGGDANSAGTDSSGGNTTVTGKADTEKAIYDKKIATQKELDKLDLELLAKNRLLLDSNLAQFDNALAVHDANIKVSESVAQSYNKTSVEYRHELNVQANEIRSKQDILHQQAEAIKASGIQSDDLTAKLKDLGGAWWDLNNKIQTTKFDWWQNQVQEIDQGMTAIQLKIDTSKAIQPTIKEDSTGYRQESENQITFLKQKQDLLHKEHLMNEKALQDDTLTQEQHRQLTEDNMKLSLEWLNVEGEIKNKEQEIYKQKEDLANKVIDLYKEMYKKQQQIVVDATTKQEQDLELAHTKEMKRLEMEHRATESLINLKIKGYEKDSNDRKYKQDLDLKERDRTELQVKINALSMDDSAEGKSNLREAKKRMLAMNTDIENFQYEHNNTVQKENLQAKLDKENLDYDTKQKTAQFSVELTTIDQKTGEKKIEIQKGVYEDLKNKLQEHKTVQTRFYEDMIADDRKFSKLKQDIINGTIDKTTTQFGVFSKFLQENSAQIAESLQKDLLDKMDEYTLKLKEIQNMPDLVTTMKGRSTRWVDANADERKQLEKDQATDAKRIGATKNANGDWVDRNGNLLFGDKYIAQGNKEQSTIVNMKTNSDAYATSNNKEELAKQNQDYAKEINAVQNSNGDWTKDGKLLYDYLYSSTDPDERKKIAEMKNNSEKWVFASDTMKDRLAKANNDIADQIHAVKDSNGDWTKNGLKLYHDGGIIGGSANKTTKLINDMFNASPNEQVVMALLDELMIPSENIAKNFMPNLGNLITQLTPSINATVAGGGNTYQILIDKVIGDENGAELVTSKIIKGIKKLGGHV